MKLEQILSPLLAAPGALAAALVDLQGETVARVGDEGVLEVLGAYESVWMAELRATVGPSGLGALREVSMDFSSRRVLAAEVGDGYFVLVVFDRAGVPSLSRKRLPAVRDLLRSEIA